MNKQNAINYILKKCKNVLTYEQVLKIANLLDENDLWSIWLNRCDRCSHDDFGICLIEVDDIAAPFCAAEISKLLKEELIKTKCEKIGIDYEEIIRNKR